MRSLFAKILVWFWCTLVITVAGSALITALEVDEDNPVHPALLGRLAAFQLDQARAAYETGGRAALSAFLGRLHQEYGIQAVLTSEDGHDLVTGADRSDLLRRARQVPVPRLGLWRMPRGLVRGAHDGGYWFLLIVPAPPLGAWIFRPERFFMLAMAALMCYWLAFHLTRPVRALQRAVERFGSGDLSARAGSERHDELGQLAHTFDRMAGRIQTLLAAERRLLLDISHELRSPLARLGVAVELARSGEENARQAALDRIQKESDRLNTLVGQLLEVTRAEGDPAALRHEALRLDELVKQLVDESGIEAAAHGCRVVFENGGPVAIEGDPELLRRAVENVIRNAIRYAPPDTPIEVSLARQNGTARIGVRDQGPGVPEEFLPRLFDAFFRVDSARDRSRGGIGLGLSIARRAVELHKGAIRARNAQPGLEVEIELPRQKP